MPSPVGIINKGPVVHRELICLNPDCAGVVQTANGPAPVQFMQKQYQNISPPPCMYCGGHFTIGKTHAAKGNGHERKADQHKVRDKLTEQVMQHAETTQHKLAENAREGDTAKLIPDQSAAAYLRETEQMAQKANMHTGFANSRFAGHRKMVAGVAADSTFARQTVADGAMMPMNALAAHTGNSGFMSPSSSGGIQSDGSTLSKFWNPSTIRRGMR